MSMQKSIRNVSSFARIEEIPADIDFHSYHQSSENFPRIFFLWSKKHGCSGPLIINHKKVCLSNPHTRLEEGNSLFFLLLLKRPHELLGHLR